MEHIKIPLSGINGKGKFTFVDGDYDGEYFSQYKWYLTTAGYARGRVDGVIVYLHSLVLKAPRGMHTDHINRDKLDNRSCNLRWVTPKENSHNRLQPVMTDDERKEKLRKFRSDPERKKRKREYDRQRYINRKSAL